MSKTKINCVTIDKALEETGYGRFNYFLIAVSGFIMVNVVQECCGISFVLPVINCDMYLTYMEKGVLGAISFLGIISSSHLWGFLADTTGRKKVINPTLFIGYLLTLASSLAPNFWTLVVLRYLNGFFLSGGSATVFAYLGEFHCNKLRNRAIMSSAFISCVASIFIPILAWAALNQNWSFEIPFLDIVYKPWRMFISLVGTLGLVCTLCLCFLPESPKYLLSVGMEEEALDVLKKMHSINKGVSDGVFKINAIISDSEMDQKPKIMNDKNQSAVSAILGSMWNQTAPLFMREHCRKTILACVIQFWTYFTAHGVYMWFPLILNKVMQYTSKNPTARLEICEILYLMEDTESAMFNSTSQTTKGCNKSLELSTFHHTISLEFIYVSLFLCMGYFTGKLGRIQTAFIVLFICGLCGVLSLFIQIPIIAVYLFIVFLVCGLATTVLNLITVDMFPTTLRAMAVCISLMMGRIGSVTGTYVVGILLEHHCKTGLLTASIALMMSGFLAFLLPNTLESTKKRKPTVLV